MAINNNADEWANPRVGIYFPADTDNTLRDGNLTGQCVSLDKWFLNEMTSVPNPGIARGHAKDFGDTLVRQGHAVQVAENNRKRGDIVVWKQDGGGYGHTGILLSGDRVFEQNVGLAGTPNKVVSGQRVYSSRIDPLYQPWRKGSPTFYRVNSYQETNSGGSSGGNMNAKGMSDAFIRRTYYMVMNQNPSQEDVNFHMAKSNPESFINGFGDNPLWKQLEAQRNSETDAKNRAIAERDQAKNELNVANEKIKKLELQLANGGGSSDKSEYVELLTTGTKIYIKK